MIVSIRTISVLVVVTALGSLIGNVYYLHHDHHNHHTTTKTTTTITTLSKAVNPSETTSSLELREQLKQISRENKELKQQQSNMSNYPYHSRANDCQRTYTHHISVSSSSDPHYPKLSEESIRRSQAFVGNRERLRHVARILANTSQSLNVVSFGGSITLAHGVVKNITAGSESYSRLLEEWLNEQFGGNHQHRRRRHRVYNMAGHGADICSLAKRITIMLSYLDQQHNVKEPDLFILEFAVNDYQGQDHVKAAVDLEDVFFDGFQNIALCAEVVVNKLLRTFPKAAIFFLEFRSGIPQRKTAQMLHMGVAQHYQVPVVSYADAVFPEFFHLVSKLNLSDMYTVPQGETMAPFPYGCHPCRPEWIITQFRNSFNPKGFKHCRTVCDLMMYAGEDCANMEPPPPGREYCNPAIFAVDAVHPSAIGHRMATLFLIHTLALAIYDDCLQTPFLPHVLPSVGWLGTPKALERRANFLMVNDTDCLVAVSCNELVPSSHSPGFSLYSDSVDFDKPGWIATERKGGEVIEFPLSLPQRPCYTVHLAILKSYRGMGLMEVSVLDRNTKTVSNMEVDGLWESQISVWSDVQVTSDNESICTGDCIVRVTTKPQEKERNGNKVKILTLSARECV